MKERADGTSAADLPADLNGIALVEVFDRFLDACRKEAAERTFEAYRDRLRFFVKHLLAKHRLRVAAADLKPFHVLEWLDDHPAWNPGMRRGAIQSVQRALNWADEVGLIQGNPVAKMRKPPQGRRDRSVTEANFERMMTSVPDGPFKLLLRFAWLSGCRPQESIRIEARHVHVETGRVIIPPGEAKGKRRVRIIFLVDDAKAILLRLVAAHPTGLLFRNEDGNRWTRFAVNCAFERLQISTGKRRLRELGVAPTEDEIRALVPQLKPTVRVKGVERPKRPAELWAEAKRKLTDRLARKHADKCCAYLLRHSFSTNALLNGVDPLTLAMLLGHANGATLAKVYSHLDQHPAHLKDAANRAGGG